MGAPQFIDHEAHVGALIDGALRAADPAARVREAARSTPPPTASFGVLSVGKAAAAMLDGMSAAFPGDRDTFLIVPEGAKAGPGALLGDHPIPTERNVEAGTQAKRFVETLAAAPTPEGLVVLLSGGASALLTLPVPGIDPKEYALLTEVMLRDGRLTIRDINCVRKHCDHLKGGRFARLLGRLWCQVYVISDVVGDPLDVIGSGPFAPDPTTFDDAARILTALPGSVETWPTVWRFVGRGVALETNDTPKPGDPVFDRVRHVVAANNATGVEGAVAVGARLGYRVGGKEVGVQGEAAEVGRQLARDARALADRAPGCLVRGGETTVNVADATGRGGRNQELALAAAIEIDGVPNVAIATFATDGVDGPTDAAGAIVTGETCARARGMGLDPGDFLARHDSYTFFAKAGGHIKTGPTGTNVNDIAIALVY